MPVGLLFEHAVCAVHATEPSGPPPSWVPVVAVPGASARERAEAEGVQVVDLHDRTYLVDERGTGEFERCSKGPLGYPEPLCTEGQRGWHPHMLCAAWRLIVPRRNNTAVRDPATEGTWGHRMASSHESAREGQAR